MNKQIYQPVMIERTFFDRHQDLANIMAHEQEHIVPDLQRAFHGLREKYLHLIENLMQEGIKEGYIKHMVDIKKAALF